MWLLFNNLHEKRITDEILAAHTRLKVQMKKETELITAAKRTNKKL